jgi:hypothetical protein
MSQQVDMHGKNIDTTATGGGRRRFYSKLRPVQNVISEIASTLDIFLPLLKENLDLKWDFQAVTNMLYISFEGGADFCSVLCRGS